MEGRLEEQMEGRLEEQMEGRLENQNKKDVSKILLIIYNEINSSTL